MINIPDTEIIKALLDSDKVESVKVEFDNGESFVIDAPYTLAVLNEKTIQSFTPKYVEPEVFEDGDIVFHKEHGLREYNSCMNGYPSLDMESYYEQVHELDLILIKKANDNGDSND